MTLIEKADQLAERAHAGQTRKESDAPYITHPRAVAQMLKDYGFEESVVAAALVHDVLEDTSVTQDELGAALGEEVLAMVRTLSYDKSLSWEEQREAYAQAVRAAPEGVKAISIADKIHNAQSLISGLQRQGSDMWKHFNRGKEKKIWFEEMMLRVFQETWQHPLVKEYAQLVRKLKEFE